MQIVIVDDESAVRTSLQKLFEEEHDVALFETGDEALKHIKENSVDLVLTDNLMPGITGTELIRRGKEISPNTAFILMTAFGSVDQAIEAIRLGADDYMMKPFDFSELRHRVRRVQDLRAWNVEQALKADAVAGLNQLLGESPAMREVKEFIRTVAVVNSPVLLLGPTGAGKEVVARAIHECGPRAAHPFIAINCASLNEQLMESELFGHEKGAFTGAASAKPGKFELAKSGTLCLDEVGELTPALQAKLLRVLQEKEFYRVGGVRHIKTDARVIAATNRNLKEMVKAGTFREDLYFRLNVITLEIPSLAARRDDLPLLIRYFWNRHCQQMGRRPHLLPETEALLLKYDWPGNVRELQNVLERLVVLAGLDERVGPHRLPAEFRAPSSAPVSAKGNSSFSDGAGLVDRVEHYERALILEVMERVGHSQPHAGKILKISRGALQYKLRKYGISGSHPQEGTSEAA